MGSFGILKKQRQFFRNGRRLFSWATLYFIIEPATLIHVYGKLNHKGGAFSFGGTLGTNGKKGSGLGLILVREFVEKK